MVDGDGCNVLIHVGDGYGILCERLFVDVHTCRSEAVQSTAWRDVRMYSWRQRMEVHRWTGVVCLSVCVCMSVCLSVVTVSQFGISTYRLSEVCWMWLCTGSMYNWLDKSPTSKGEEKGEV